MPYINSTRTVDNGVGVDIALAGAGSLFLASGLLSAQKSITLSDGFLNNGAPEENLIIPVLFPNGHNDLGPSLHASLAVTGVSNPIPIVSNQQGTLNPLPHHQMTEGGSTVYKVLQPNTVLELYYTSDYDGNGTPAFVIVGNPLVLSSADYTIYANGSFKEGDCGDIKVWFSNTIPYGWLLCNGQSCASYSNLTTFLGKNTVPDLRGEFLRGAGTNSHVEQGSGGSVGQHQDATTIPSFTSYVPNNSMYIGKESVGVLNSDTAKRSQNVVYFNYDASGQSGSADIMYQASTRPTNTSVNYIIKW